MGWLRRKQEQSKQVQAADRPARRPKRPKIMLQQKPIERQLEDPVVMAVANRKGGVGKTTTSVNMATTLAYMGHPVLLVDMDSQGHSTSGLGIERSEIDGTVLDILLDLGSAEDVLLASDLPGLDLIPANVDLSRANVELVDHPERELQLRRALDPIKDYYDFIFIDTPPSLGLLTVNSLVAADRVLIPLQCEYFALEGVKDLVGIVKVVSDNLNPALKIEGILITMFERTPLSLEIAEEVRDHFGRTVLRAAVPRDRKVAEAQSMGVPIAHYDMRSPSSQAYIRAARELRNKYMQ